LRRIDMIIIHCSATEAGREYTVGDITDWHKKRGFRTIGYHFLIHTDGSIDGSAEGCRPLSEIGAHAKGYNSHSIGICYIGGLKNGKPADTRTHEQTESLRLLVKVLSSIFPSVIIGHNEVSNKACPCFNVSTEL